MAKGDIVPADAAAADDEGPSDADLDVPANGGKPTRTPANARAAGPGFFTIYKNRQGKWTRLGTAFAAAGLGLLTAYNLYQYALPYLPAYDPELHNGGKVQAARYITLAVVVLLLAAFGVLVFWLGNKPKNVDFLIATDSEMKKVNWTTKGELFGSTRVVVLFLVFIAVFLFGVDLMFQTFFKLIRVLR